MIKEIAGTAKREAPRPHDRAEPYRVNCTGGDSEGEREREREKEKERAHAQWPPRAQQGLVLKPHLVDDFVDGRACYVFRVQDSGFSV